MALAGPGGLTGQGWVCRAGLGMPGRVRTDVPYTIGGVTGSIYPIYSTPSPKPVGSPAPVHLQRCHRTSPARARVHHPVCHTGSFEAGTKGVTALLWFAERVFRLPLFLLFPESGSIKPKSSYTESLVELTNILLGNNILIRLIVPCRDPTRLKTILRPAGIAQTPQ